MIKKIILLILFAIFLCGCTSKQSNNTIVFASWGSVSEVKILKQIISNFEKETPNSKVEFIHIPQNYFQKLHLLFASNSAPDVVFINNLYLPIYAKYLEDLTSLVETGDFYPQTISGMSIEGKLLAIPRDISNLVVYVNTDKMTLPSNAWNLEDLINSGQKSVKPCFGIGAENDIFWVTPYLAYFGGGIININGENIIETNESQQAIKFYKDLYQNGISPSKSEIGSSTLAQMFLNEKLIMYVSGRWMYPKITEKANFNWAVINFPYGKNPINSDTSGWAISKQSKNKELAQKFVQYLSSEKSSEYFTDTGLVVPARIKTSQKLNSIKHNEKAFLEVIKHSQTTPVVKDYKKITDKINSEYFN